MPQEEKRTNNVPSLPDISDVQDQQPDPQQPQADPQQSDPQPPTAAEALAGSAPQPAAPDLPPAAAPAPPKFAPTIASRIVGSVLGLAQGLTGSIDGRGGLVGGIEGAIQGGFQPNVPAQRQQDAKTLEQNQVQESQSRVKFMSAQAAHMQADLAVQKIQTENLPAEIQQQRDAAGLTMMKQMQDLGFTPAMITSDTPQGHQAALAQMTKTLGAVPPLATLHVGGQLVSYNLSSPDQGGAAYQLVKSMAPLMALPNMSYADFQKLSPEKRIDLAQQAATFWQPAADPKDSRGQIENYRSLKATYLSQHPDDTATARKFDTTIQGLQQSGMHFLTQDVQRKFQMDRAEQLAKQNAMFSDTGENSLASQLVEGQLDPYQLSKRGQDYSALLKSANQYSLSKYGKPFDAAQAQQDYKFASNPQTQNTLKYLNSLTGNDNVSGNLGTLVKLSDSISRTKFPSLNDAAAWGRLQAGDPVMAQYHTAVTEVADQVAKILQGGGSGTSDAKLKQASDLFRLGYNKDQLTATATTLRDLLANRKTELIGNNRYLQRQYNVTPASVGGTKSASAGSNTGATHTYDPSTGTVTPIQGGK